MSIQEERQKYDTLAAQLKELQAELDKQRSVVNKLVQQESVREWKVGDYAVHHILGSNKVDVVKVLNVSHSMGRTTVQLAIHALCPSILRSSFSVVDVDSINAILTSYQPISHETYKLLVKMYTDAHSNFAWQGLWEMDMDRVKALAL